MQNTVNIGTHVNVCGKHVADGSAVHDGMVCAARGGMPTRMQISGRSFIIVFFPRFCLLKPLR